jgi:flagellar protein FliO/FliZ
MFRIVLFLTLVPAVVHGAGAPEAASPLAGGLRFLGGTVLVVGLILFAYAASRRWLPAAKGGLIRVVEMRSLGPKKSLCLVEVKGRELLLGLSADRVELLCQFDGDREPTFDEALTRQLEGGS